MTDNVLIAIIAVSGVIVSATCVLGAAIFTYISSSKQFDKRFDKIDALLVSIQADMKEFYRLHVRLEAKVDAKS